MNEPVMKYESEMEVRDYECDMQAIVNNAVYLNYLEHARHRAIRDAGITFRSLCEQGIFAVVRRSEVDYLRPLESGDRFVVRTGMVREGRLKLVFHQHIERKSDGERTLKARITVACVQNGRPVMPQIVLDAIERANQV